MDPGGSGDNKHMTDSTAQAAGDDVFGHPRGLMTLFFTELWERFGYYGMRALLILYMTDAARGGLGMETEISGAIYGLFTFGVYALALPGGWIADRVGLPQVADVGYETPGSFGTWSLEQGINIITWELPLEPISDLIASHAPVLRRLITGERLPETA